MVMAALASAEFVNLPLKSWAARRWRVVERYADRGNITVACAVVTLGIIAAQAVFGGGGFFNDTRSGIARLEDQSRQINARIDLLSKKIEEGPRTDQLLQQAQAIAEINGKLSSLESQLHTMQTQLAVQAAEMKSITLASEKNLSGRK